MQSEISSSFSFQPLIVCSSVEPFHTGLLSEICGTGVERRGSKQAHVWIVGGKIHRSSCDRGGVTGSGES